MRPEFAESDLNAELVFDRFLGAGEDLDVLQPLLAGLAPRWCSRLRLWRSRTDQRPIDVHKPGAMRSVVVRAAGERGETYRALVRAYGRPPHERFFGSAELRGAGPELTVIVSLDEAVISPLGAKTRLGNHVSLQVRRRKVEGRGAADWTSEACERLCADLSPVWGCARHENEYWAKVMSDGDRIEAIGRDFGRFLPGVFWLNFFGRRYRQLMGDERLRSAPAETVVSIDDGVLIGLGGVPQAWQSAAYVRNEQNVLDHLGPEFFFSKPEPDRQTVAPDWNS